jgi:hypothetical protein
LLGVVKTQYLGRQQKTHRQLQTVQSLARPCQDLSAGLLIKLNLALNCSAALPGLPASGDEATATTNNLQGLFPLHTRRTLLLQWLLHMKVSPYDGYLSKGKQALTPIRYKAKGV